MGKIDPNNGLTLVYTGNGKGKTTASLGLAMRAVGRGQKVLIIQFIKSPQRDYGEERSLKKLGIEVIQTGIGFTWKKTPEEHRQALKAAWKLTKKRVMEGKHDLIILDEINNALAIDRFSIADVLPLEEVLKLIDQRPKGINLVLTGRDAQKEIIRKADLVSEVVMRKHYYEKGVPAVVGLEL